MDAQSHVLAHWPVVIGGLRVLSLAYQATLVIFCSSKSSFKIFRCKKSNGHFEECIGMARKRCPLNVVSCHQTQNLIFLNKCVNCSAFSTGLETRGTWASEEKNLDERAVEPWNEKSPWEQEWNKAWNSGALEDGRWNQDLWTSGKRARSLSLPTTVIVLTSRSSYTIRSKKKGHSDSWVGVGDRHN